MQGKLPPCDLRGEFFLQMKFYWAREHQRASPQKQMFTGGIYTGIQKTGGMQPLFVDYDWTTLAKVRRSVKRLQRKWRLGDAYVYASVKTSLHVKFFYDWFPFKKIVQILESDPAIDKGYIAIAKRQRGCVLRTCAKPNRPAPKPVAVIKSLHQQNKTQREVDWGDLLKMATDALLGNRHYWLKSFRKGQLLKRKD